MRFLNRYLCLVLGCLPLLAARAQETSSAPVLRIMTRHGMLGTALAAALLGLAVSPGAWAAEPQPKVKANKQDCIPLLVAMEDSGRVHLRLDSCDVSLESFGSAGNPATVLRLKEDEAASWREHFAAPGPAADALAGGKIVLRSENREVIHAASLADAVNVPASERDTWLWNRSEGTLSTKSFPADEHASWYRVCEAAVRGANLTLAMPDKLPRGEMFSPVLIKSAPWGQPNGVPKQCAADWKLSAGAPAIMHPQWGLGMVSGEAREGERFTVQVRVGTTTLAKEVQVVSPFRQALAGNWRQVGERACDSVELRKPAVPISEFHLRRDGSFDLTWVPRNHHYIDYIGTYAHDPQSGAFAWTITGGQGEPVVAGKTGSARINERGLLVIAGLHPGSKNVEARICELVFENTLIAK